MRSSFLSKRLVLAIQRDLVDTFGGLHGIRDERLLDSALAQPKATGGGRLLHRTVYDQAAAYLFHLSSNHLFVDGNKRLAFAAMDTFLRINGVRLTLSNEEAYELAIMVAQGTLRKSRIVALLRKSSEPI